MSDFISRLENSCRIVEVDCAEFGKFLLKPFTAGQALAFEKRIESADFSKELIREFMVVETLVDAEGMKLLTDVESLSGKIHNKLLNLLADHAFKINSSSDEAIKEAKKV